MGTSLLTGSLAFAGFVLAAETYRSYKEKEETEVKQVEPAKEEQKIVEPAVLAAEPEVVKEESLPAKEEQVTADAKVEEAIAPAMVVAKEEAPVVVVEEVKAEAPE